MPLKKSYRFLRGLLRVFTPRVKTVWDVPFDGTPSVFCPNHARAWGPIDMCLYFEYCDQVHPWYNSGVIDRKGLPAYVRNDNWWNPKSPLAWLYNAVIPPVVSWLLPPIIRCTPGIPVYNSLKVLTTFRQSIRCLEAGEHVVIFPQLPTGYNQHDGELISGFLQIAPLAWQKLGLALKFYPVHVDQEQRTIRVMEPVVYNPDLPLAEQQESMLKALSAGVWD